MYVCIRLLRYLPDLVYETAQEIVDTAIESDIKKSLIRCFNSKVHTMCLFCFLFCFLFYFILFIYLFLIYMSTIYNINIYCIYICIYSHKLKKFWNCCLSRILRYSLKFMTRETMKSFKNRKENDESLDSTAPPPTTTS